LSIAGPHPPPPRRLRLRLLPGAVFSDKFTFDNAEDFLIIRQHNSRVWKVNRISTNEVLITIDADKSPGSEVHIGTADGRPLAVLRKAPLAISWNISLMDVRGKPHDLAQAKGRWVRGCGTRSPTRHAVHSACRRASQPHPGPCLHPAAPPPAGRGASKHARSHPCCRMMEEGLGVRLTGESSSRFHVGTNDHSMKT
jgi:hypothetical protein